MSLHANKSSIALFTLGSLLLGGLMVYFFGGEQKMARHVFLLMYFNGSVNGLSKGSPVKFRGVPIGRVDSIGIHYKQAPDDDTLPVFVSLDMDRLSQSLGWKDDLSDPKVLADKIKQGLRAKTEVESLPFGTLYVKFDYYKDAPPPPPVRPDLGIGVVPTLSSAPAANPQAIRDALNGLQSFDFEGKGEFIKTASDEVSGIPFARYNQTVLDSLQKVNALNLPQWSSRVGGLLQQMTTLQTNLASTNEQIVQQAGNLVGMGESAKGNIQRVNDSLAAISAQLQPGGPASEQFKQTLGQIDDAAKSLDKQVEALEQQPAVLGAKGH